MSPGMYSNVGNRLIYNDGDQRNESKEEKKSRNIGPFHQGEAHSYKNLDDSAWLYSILLIYGTLLFRLAIAFDFGFEA